MFLFSRRYIKLMKSENGLYRCYMNTIKSFQNVALNNSYKQLSIFQSRICSTNNELDATIVDVEAITNGDKSLEHKLKVIILEAEVMRQEGRPVPEQNYIKPDHWTELLSLPSRSARMKYFEFLFRLSKRKESQMAKKLQKQLMWKESLKYTDQSKVEETFEDFALTYDLSHNNIFMRIYESTMNHMYNNRLIQAIMFGQKLIIDCGYEENMTKRENINCAKQLMLTFSENRFHEDPFDLHFCNANREGLLMNKLKRHIPPMDEPSFPMNIHECSYLDLFPRDKLVYLTPHCKTELTEYDHDALYIIGGIVDKVNNEPLSLAKAKRENIKMMKLPLDRYLNWGAGSGKSLTLNHVIAILLDIKSSGDWNFALRHVPRRKLVDTNISNNIQNYSNQLRYDRPMRKAWSPKSKKNRFLDDNRQFIK